MSALPSDRAVTLRQVWADYQLSRNLKPSTLKAYRCVLESSLRDWLGLPVTAISKRMVEMKHRELSCASASQANLTMRVLRALLTYAEYKYDDDQGESVITANPVKVLSVLKTWNKVRPRKRFIDAGKMPRWFQAVTALRSRDETFSDYLIFLLLTGLRRTEAAKLTWNDVDLSWGVLRIKDTKNGDEHELPMSDYLLELLKRRRASAKSGYVFPGRVNSYISSNCRTYKLLFDELGFEFTPHDLRRTFTTTADGFDFPDRIIKALVNHRAQNVTDKYIQRNVERLRVPMQAITDEILRQARQV